MCEIKITRISVEHSWNAHGISGVDVGPPVAEGDGVDVGIVYHSRCRVDWLGMMFLS